MLRRMMTTKVQVILFVSLFALFGVRITNGQSRVEALRDRERELTERLERLERVNPDSPNVDRLAQQAADVKHERQQLERQEKQRSESIGSRPDNVSNAQGRLEAARAKERELTRAAERLERANPDSINADRLSQAAANATYERQQLERQMRQQAGGRDNQVSARSRKQDRWLSPSELPKNLRDRVGSPYFYNARSIDLVSRNPGRQDPYYMRFGAKYYDRYTKMSPTLTPRGQAFIRDVGPRLQRMIEERRQTDPAGFARMERNPYEFSKFVFDTHWRAYYASGWADLPRSDQSMIRGAIDLRDLMSWPAIGAAIRLVPGFVGIDPTRPGRPQYNQARGVRGRTTDGRRYRF